jgi:hypothetical protein
MIDAVAELFPVFTAKLWQPPEDAIATAAT